ncbi:hypothetical protein AAZX31_06G134100 [Glycine max]|nr:hypothetical protein GLYMA_06G140450v4 [Glycine max]KAH1125824.1 hypothetical protein GYH30_015056 [Glycine max]
MSQVRIISLIFLIKLTFINKKIKIICYQSCFLQSLQLLFSHHWIQCFAVYISPNCGSHQSTKTPFYWIFLTIHWDPLLLLYIKEKGKIK